MTKKWTRRKVNLNCSKIISKGKPYSKLREYDTIEECQEALETFEDTTWLEKNRVLTNDGLKLWHKCTHCEKRLYILYQRRNLGVSLFVEANPHQEHTPNDYFIPEKTKLKVLELAETYKTKYVCQW